MDLSLATTYQRRELQAADDREFADRRFRHAVQPVCSAALQSLPFPRFRTRAHDAVARLLLRREPRISRHPDHRHFGTFPFDHGRVGRKVVINRHGRFAHHGEDLVIIQASHGGYDADKADVICYRRVFRLVTQVRR